MYLRTTQRKNRDGSIVRYVQLAHNRRVDGVTQAAVLANLGREDRLDREGLRRLVASINRYLADADADADADGGDGDVRVEVGDALSVVGSRPMGTAWLLDGLWSQLGIAAALGDVLGQRKFTTDVERVLFALVAKGSEMLSPLWQALPDSIVWLPQEARAAVDEIAEAFRIVETIPELDETFIERSERLVAAEGLRAEQLATALYDWVRSDADEVSVPAWHGEQRRYHEQLLRMWTEYLDEGRRLLDEDRMCDRAPGDE